MRLEICLNWREIDRLDLRFTDTDARRLTRGLYDIYKYVFSQYQRTVHWGGAE